MFSFGFQQAYQRGFDQGDIIFFTTVCIFFLYNYPYWLIKIDISVWKLLQRWSKTWSMVLHQVVICAMRQMVGLHSPSSYFCDFNCHRSFRSFCLRIFCFCLSPQGMFDRFLWSIWCYIESYYCCSFFDQNFQDFWRKIKRIMFLIWLDDSFKLWALQRLL